MNIWVILVAPLNPQQEWFIDFIAMVLDPFWRLKCQQGFDEYNHELCLVNSRVPSAGVVGIFYVSTRVLARSSSLSSSKDHVLSGTGFLMEGQHIPCLVED